MTDPTTGPIQSREEVVEAIENLLHGWNVPESVPEAISTAIVPLGEDPVSARLIAKGIHTLVLRSRPRCLVLVGASPELQNGKIVLSPFGEIPSTAGDVAINERIASRLATFWSSEVEASTDQQQFDLLPLHRIGALLTRVLAPGCRVVPVTVPADPSGDFDPVATGTGLGEILTDEPGTIVVAGAELGADGPGVEGDARILRHLIDIDPLALSTEAQTIAGPSPVPLVIAAAHAKVRGQNRGVLLEHARIGADESGSRVVSVVL